jgi:hypothetical protein
MLPRFLTTAATTTTSTLFRQTIKKMAPVTHIGKLQSPNLPISRHSDPLTQYLELTPVRFVSLTTSMMAIVVGFRFKPTVSEEDKQRLIKEMVGLKKNCVKEDGKPYILVSLPEYTGVGIDEIEVLGLGADLDTSFHAIIAPPGCHSYPLWIVDVITYHHHPTVVPDRRPPILPGKRLCDPTRPRLPRPLPIRSRQGLLSREGRGAQEVWWGDGGGVVGWEEWRGGRLGFRACFGRLRPRRARSGLGLRSGIFEFKVVTATFLHGFLYYVLLLIQ